MVNFTQKMFLKDLVGVAENSDGTVFKVYKVIEKSKDRINHNDFSLVKGKQTVANYLIYVYKHDCLYFAVVDDLNKDGNDELKNAQWFFENNSNHFEQLI